MATLHKLFDNILANPSEEKFRILKRSNKVIQAKVFGVTDIETFLLLAGYEPMDEEHLKFTGETDQLTRARDAVQAEQERLAPPMSE